MVTLPRRETISDINTMSDQSALRSVDQQIGNDLRALYSDILNEPIPERFLTLIDRLSAGDPTPSAEAFEEVEG